jgi:CMP-N,N'-diacetyllegionaminic acid synthase
MNIALITARGGSKGLKRKNILSMNGIPLIGWSIKAASECPEIHDCYVTTEDSEIADVAISLGAKVIRRPVELASDSSSSEDAISHALSVLGSQGLKIDKMVLLQPTSPLRTASDISKALLIMNDKNAECVISVFEPKHSAAKAYKVAVGGKLIGLLSESAPYTPRQELPNTYQPNGAIYAFNVDAYLAENKIPRGNVFPYIMLEDRSIDIDTIDDFNIAEEVLRSGNEA